MNTLIRDASFEPLRKCERATTFKQTPNEKGELKWTPCSPSDPQGKPMKMMDLAGGKLHLPALEIVFQVTAIIGRLL
jgi:vacuolar protein-sorting-associated protein 4